MTPEELRKIAQTASEKEYKDVLEKLKKAAEEGAYSCRIRDLSDAAISQLREAGYKVEKKLGDRTTPSGLSYEVNFEK